MLDLCYKTLHYMELTDYTKCIAFCLQISGLGYDGFYTILLWWLSLLHILSTLKSVQFLTSHPWKWFILTENTYISLNKFLGKRVLLWQHKHLFSEWIWNKAQRTATEIEKTGKFFSYMFWFMPPINPPHQFCKEYLNDPVPISL